jgi:hypothetical protein
MSDSMMEKLMQAQYRANVLNAEQAPISAGQTLSWLMNVLDAPLNSTQGMATEFSRSLQRGESPLDAVSAGQKGAVSGLLQEKDYSYLEAIPPELQAEYPKTSAAFGLGADILLDPSLVAGGAIFKTGKTAVNSLRKFDIDGQVASTFSNYLDNFYGMTDKEFKEAGTFTKLLGEAFALRPFSEKLTTREGTAAIAKVKGFVSAMANGVKDLGGIMVSPTARALWAEQGLNEKAIKIIEKRLTDSLTESGFDLKSPEGKKAIAQAQFHILALVKAGKEDAIPEALQRISDVSFLGGIVPYNKNAYKTVIKENSRITNNVTGRKVNVPDKTLDQAMDHVAEAWGLPLEDPLTSLSVKRAQGSGGGHIYDAARKNPSNAEIRNAFKDLDKKGTKATNTALFDYFSKSLSKKQSKSKLLTKSAEDAKENGIWLMSSGRSVSYLEGGINILTHIDHKGRSTIFISDEQNFLENIPVVKNLTEGALGGQPVKSITVSEPIVLDAIKGLDIKANANLNRLSEFSIVNPNAPASDRKLFSQDFSALLSAKSSDEMLKAMKTQMLGEGLLATSAVQKLRSDDD